MNDPGCGVRSMLDAPGLARAFAIGAVAATGYALAAVLWCGVVLDETVDFAQVVSGAVKYPPAHPHAVYFGASPTLMSDLAALVWWLVEDAHVLSALRNVLQVFTTVLAPFALTLALTRRAGWGYIAAAATLTGTSFYEYIGAYLPAVLPNYFSTGQIGMNLVLILVACVLMQRHRLGALLAGGLPAIHAVMAVPVWPWLLAHVAATDRSVAGLGLLVRAGVVLIASGIYLLVRVLDTSGVGAAFVLPMGAEAEAIYAGFTSLDVHRQPFTVVSAAYLANPVVLFGMLCLSLLHAHSDDAALRRRLVSLLMLGIVIWAWVYGWRVFGAIAGYVPKAILVSMPNRFSHLSAMLLVPVSIAAFAVVHARTASPARMQAALTALLLLAAVCYVVNADRVQRYLLPGLWALTLAASIDVAFRQRRGRTTTVAIVVAVAAALMATKEARIGIALVIGVCVLFLSFRYLRETSLLARLTARLATPAAALIACVLLAAAVLQVGLARPIHDPMLRITAFDRELGDWLSTHAPGEPVVGFLHPYSYLQAKTGAPVAADLTTLYMVSYRPDLAPVIGPIARDIYGIDLTRPTGFQSIVDAMADRRVWSARSRAQWQALGQRYGFRLVLAPADFSVDLSPLLVGADWTLYATGDSPPPRSALPVGAGGGGGRWPMPTMETPTGKSATDNSHASQR